MTKDESLALYNAGPKVLVKILCDLSRTIESQQMQIKALEIKIAKLSKNSSNSSKRPSSDDITKPKIKNQKGQKNGARKIGGQPGHERHDRPPFTDSEIDKTHPYILTACPVCNGEVSMLDTPPRIIQQMELVEVPIIKEEHRSYPVWCDKCQKIHYMPFPVNVVKEGLFKERLTAMVAYMKNVCHASFSTIRKFIRDVLGEKVSRGYLRKVIEKVSQSLESPYSELLNRLPFEERVNVDETGHKENKVKFWTWVFKAEMYVLFKIDKSRGSKVLIDVLGKEFDGVLGCDYFSAYRKYMKDFNVTMQFCIAHLIRDIRFLTTLPDEQTKAYGERLLDEIRNMFKVIHERDNMVQEDFTNALEKAKERIITAALQNVPGQLNKDGKEEKREAKNMANRFRKHGKAYFEFITTPGIGPTNNVAEQAIRFVVIDRLITQGTRSIKGRKSSERLWTVIATCALQGRSAFNFILQAIQAYFNNDPAPSLVPDTS
ncbi:MAG: IS66 family transposase [Proteobacteria bacterium]|nr:IS66 family transposase [Pseudomonadota bacterium]MBU1695449.1 IS66 family transposase [Pseudomonadota bacterium]